MPPLSRLLAGVALLTACDAKHEVQRTSAGAEASITAVNEKPPATSGPDVAEPRTIVPTGMPACDQMFKLYRDVSDCTKAPLELEFEAGLAKKAKDWSTQPPEMKAGIETACAQSVTDLKQQLAACQNPPPDEEE